MSDQGSAPGTALRHGAIARRILIAFYDVYNELGTGFLESVYHAALERALTDASLRVRREVPIEVFFRGAVIGKYYADLVVDECVVIEVKCARDVRPEHDAQLLHYLRATAMEVGLLLNFGPSPTFKRLVCSNDLKRSRATGDPRSPV